MKKTLLLGGAIALVFAFSSCKKTYTCECTTVVPGLSTASIEYEFKDTKKKAENSCEDMSTTITAGSYTSTTTCKIK